MIAEIGATIFYFESKIAALTDYWGLLLTYHQKTPSRKIVDYTTTTCSLHFESIHFLSLDLMTFLQSFFELWAVCELSRAVIAVMTSNQQGDLLSKFSNSSSHHLAFADENCVAKQMLASCGFLAVISCHSYCTFWPFWAVSAHCALNLLWMTVLPSLTSLFEMFETSCWQQR